MYAHYLATIVVISGMKACKDIALSFQDKADADMFWDMIEKCREQKSLISSDILPEQDIDESISIIEKPITKEMLPILTEFMESRVITGKDAVVQSIVQHVTY